MFVTPAFAQGSSPTSGFDPFGTLLLMVPLFVIFYFFLIRPQQQRQKQHREMVAHIRRGDTVVTAGGIIGLVTRVKDDNEIEVEIADNTRVRVVKWTVTEVRAKGEPVKETT